MIPITVFADLRPPGPSLNSPLLLDTLVSVGLSIWLNRSDPIGHARHFIGPRSRMFPIKAHLHCDINTEEDWQRAKELYARHHGIAAAEK